MKKNILKLLAVVAFVFALSACEQENKLIIGEWSYTNDTTYIDSEGDEFISIIEQTCAFYKNGSYISIINYSGVYEKFIGDSGDEPNFSTETVGGEYNFSDGILTIEGGLLPTIGDKLELIMTKPVSSKYCGTQIECVSIDGTKYIYNKK